ncbi:ABC transporter ATP-binding protein [Desulforamulus ruminis]|uniref:ABC transporter related protein n=1 Tax=Desulforamulus ruminis (strain ATCC 23193 / DSM 2154 / NCIMB 8452 / DL) TaxID=696281 RepID=F6DVD9_DESRL|nr:ATP-binding cassette domain-containing protein [Desulforamulus ruminis]AEG60292.1 ABC transporter related protein [Desulforamulus ruminis DSM 2154]
MKERLLEVKNLELRVGKFSLSNLSFSLNAGEYVMILGPTGAGKTILLECIAGLQTPHRGEIFLHGRKVTDFPPEQRHLGFAYQDSLLYPFLTVRENILFGARARGLATEAGVIKRMNELIEIMGISHLLERYPANLSGGEKQRVSLARAILTQPSLLLLDEPLSALDPGTRRSMQNLLREIHTTENLGILHVTHDFSEALQLGTQMMVLNNGCLEQSGLPLEVFFKPSSLEVAKFLQGENLIPGYLIFANHAAWFKPELGKPLIGPLPKNLAPDSACNTENPVVLMIRSSNLSLHQPGETPGECISWPAQIQYLSFNRTHVDVHCRGYGLWETSLSLSQWHKLALSEGDPVLLAVKPEHCHFIAV